MSPAVYATAPVQPRRRLGAVEEPDDRPPPPPSAATGVPFVLLAVPAAIVLWLYRDAFSA